MLLFYRLYAIIGSMLQGIISFLVGKKTYIIGGLMIVLGILTGNNDMVLQGLGFMTLRAAISEPKG